MSILHFFPKDLSHGKRICRSKQKQRETRLLYRKSVKSFVCCYGNQTIDGLSDTNTEFLFSFDCSQKLLQTQTKFTQYQINSIACIICREKLTTSEKVLTLQEEMHGSMESVQTTTEEQALQPKYQGKNSKDKATNAMNCTVVSGRAACVFRGGLVGLQHPSSCACHILMNNPTYREKCL